MKHNIVSAMILCPGWQGEECDRIVTIEYDIDTAKVIGAEGCPHIIEYDEPALFDLTFDCFPAEELEQRRIPRRGRRVKKQNPTAIDEEMQMSDEYDVGGEA